MTREQWLNQAVTELARLFKRAGFDLPDKIRVSCSWPSRSAMAKKVRRVGEAWSPDCSKDGYRETFISPMLSDSVDVLGTLVHELCHHAVGIEAGHGPAFRRCALAVGLEGKMTSTENGPEPTEQLKRLVGKIDEYPHATLDSTKSNRKKQSTRLLKAICEDCGYTIRLTKKWADQGLPTCCCGSEMELE